MTLKLYFMKCLERKISQCILPFTHLIFVRCYAIIIEQNTKACRKLKKRHVVKVGAGPQNPGSGISEPKTREPPPQNETRKPLKVSK